MLGEAGLKMPHLAVPVRLLVFGREQTPSVDAMLAQMPRQTVIDGWSSGGSDSAQSALRCKAPDPAHLTHNNCAHDRRAIRIRPQDDTPWQATPSAGSSA